MVYLNYEMVSLQAITSSYTALKAKKFTGKSWTMIKGFLKSTPPD